MSESNVFEWIIWSLKQERYDVIAFLEKDKYFLKDLMDEWENCAQGAFIDEGRYVKGTLSFQDWFKLESIADIIVLWADYKRLSGGEELAQFSARTLLYGIDYGDDSQTLRLIERWESYEWICLAEEFLRRVRHLVEFETHTKKDVKKGRIKLHPTVEKIAKFIDENPGKPGKIIASGVDVTDEHFRRLVSTKLKKLGYHNPGGNRGYFPPDDV